MHSDFEFRDRAAASATLCRHREKKSVYLEISVNTNVYIYIDVHIILYSIVIFDIYIIDYTSIKGLNKYLKFHTSTREILNETATM